MKSNGLSHVVVETDCQEVVNSFYSNKEDCSYFYDIIVDYQNLLRSMEVVSLAFVKRTTNSVANVLMRAVVSMTVYGKWACPSSFLYDVLNSDL